MSGATFNALLARYENATPSERQRVLDAIPRSRFGEPTDIHRVLWEDALRLVFEADAAPQSPSEAELEALDNLKREPENEPDGTIRDGIARYRRMAP